MNMWAGDKLSGDRGSQPSGFRGGSQLCFSLVMLSRLETLDGQRATTNDNERLFADADAAADADCRADRCSSTRVYL